jgi:hypothetical protein
MKISNSIGVSGLPIVVNNYSALPIPSSVVGSFYWCSNSQGSDWNPFVGSFKNSGMYYSNGTSWEFLKVPYQATQLEIDTELNNDKFVTAFTLANASKWLTKQASLISGTNIKTVNGATLLGSGDLIVSGGLTNLTTTQSASNVIINSDTGTDATIALGNGINAGVSINDYTTAEKNKLSAISGANTGDQTSIVGINGTKAQFNTSVSDGDIQFVGDAPTAHTHLLSNITDVTITVANLNSLDDGVNTTLHFHDSDRARANHTGTQTASTISDFNTQVATTSLLKANNLSDLSNIVTAKTNLSLQNVDNTTDANKPISTATQTALNLKANLASPTFTGTVGGITATMVGAPSGSGTSTGANTGDNSVNTLYSGLVSNATHTGDASGSTVLTLATVATAGTTGSSTAIPVVTINAKGLTTSITTTPVIAPAGTLSGVALNSTVTGSSLTSVGTLGALTVTAPITGSVTGNSAGFTGNLVGEVTGTQGATVVGNAAVISKVLTGYTSGAGTVASTDNILQAVQKINGNDALKAPLVSPTFTGIVTLPAGQVVNGVTLSTAAGSTNYLKGDGTYGPSGGSQSVDILKVKRITTSQTLALNTDIVFNSTPSGSITYNNTTGLATLLVGKTYRIKARLVGRNDGTGSTGRYITYEIVTSANASLPSTANSTTGTQVLATSALNEGGGGEATADYAPTVNTDIKIRITGIDGSNWTLDNDRSYLEIQQLGSSATTQFTGATGTVAGAGGFVPSPAATDNVNYLKGDGTWGLPNINGTAITPTSTNGVSAATMAFNDATSSIQTQINSKQTTFGSQTANFIYAAPSGVAGTPVFRAVTALDIPTLNQNTTGTAANITATTNSTLNALTALTSLSATSASTGSLLNVANISNPNINIGNGTALNLTSGTNWDARMAQVPTNVGVNSLQLQLMGSTNTTYSTGLTISNQAGVVNTGVGTTVPTAVFHTNGTIRLQGIGESVGRILTSDATGNATWQAAPLITRSTVASSGAINTTATYIAPTTFSIPANTLAAGDVFRITIYGTNTSTAAGVNTFTPRLGALGTTADLALTTFASTSAASGTNIPFVLVINVVVRAVGASGSVYTYGVLDNNGVTGISAITNVINTGTAITVNTTGALVLGCSLATAATTTTTTIQNVIVQKI